MAIPSSKSGSMTDFLERRMGRTTAIFSDKCTSCKKDAVKFRDPISEREYTISGLCQSCQDGVFGRSATK